VTTGDPNSSVKTEAFDVVASTTCQSLPAYPLTMYSATGAFVKAKLVICGGQYPITSNCYTLSRTENTWKLSGNLITPRLGAASVEINNKLFIFGGADDPWAYSYLQSTEEFDVDSGTSTAGPNMPLGIAYHCAVKVNDTTVLIIGGSDGSSELSSSYFYNAELETFTAGPSLTVARYWHACSILTERYVIVTGGYNGAYFFNSTEYMDLNQPTMWKTGL